MIDEAKRPGKVHEIKNMINPMELSVFDTK